MSYFIDSNICIYHLNDLDASVSEKMEKTPAKDIKIPSVVAAELLFGAEKSVKREYNLEIVRKFLSLFEIVGFDEKSAEHYAAVRVLLERKGQILGVSDIEIASIVLANEGVLITHSVSKFSRIGGLIVEDWTSH